jgi:hypothetical protein
MSATALMAIEVGAPLPTHQRELLAEHVTEIKRLGRRMVADAIEIGRRLDACKFIVGHGNWTDWLRTEFNWSHSTAQNLVNVYEMAKSKSTNFANLDLPLSALYLIAAPSTPPEAVDEVIERAERGEVIKLAEVRETIAEHKAPAKKPRPDLDELASRAKRLGWWLDGIGSRRLELCKDVGKDRAFVEMPVRLRDVAATLDKIERDPDAFRHLYPRAPEPEEAPEPAADDIDVEYVLATYTEQCAEHVRNAIDGAIVDMEGAPKADIAARLFPTLRALIDELEAKFRSGGDA